MLGVKSVAKRCAALGIPTTQGDNKAKPPGNTHMPYRPTFLVVITAAVLFSGEPHAGAGRADPVYISIDVPGALRTAAFAVNSDGAVVGDYALTRSESQVGGYLWQDGVFTAIDFPGS